jgi:hypothetical protein
MGISLTTKSTNFHEWGTASPVNFFVGFIRKFDSLAPTRLTLRANLRLLYLPPATALGCGSNERFGAHRDAATGKSAVGFIRVYSCSSWFECLVLGHPGKAGCGLAERLGAHRDAATGESAVGFIRVYSWFECLALGHPSKAGCGLTERFGAHRDAATGKSAVGFIRALRGSNVWCLDIQARWDAERFGAHRDAATTALIETPLQVNQLSVLFVDTKKRGHGFETVTPF